MQSLNATCIGHDARRLLQGDARGAVLTAVSNAVYLQTASGEILWISGDEASRHQRGLLVDRTIDRLKADSPFRMRGSTMLLGDGTRIETGGAAVWHAQAQDTLSLLPLHRLPGRWIEITQFYAPLHMQGFGAFVDLIKFRAFPASFRRSETRLGPFHQAALPMLERVLDCCLNHELAGVLHHGQGLIGLGSGLTPSGDDYLGGLLFAIHHLGAVYRIEGLLRPDLLQPWLHRARTQTHVISHTLLSDHTSGSGAETLHYFVHSFLSQEPVKTVMCHARRLEKLGHSTGGDLIAGVLSGMLFAFSARPVGRTAAMDQAVRIMES